MKLEFESNTASLPLIDHHDVDEIISDSDSPEVTRMLRKGIKAAQEGRRSEARTQLLRVTEADANNENAWLWLASISEYPEELLVFLKNVLNINPDNERANEWAKATETLMAKTFVQRGIDASKNDQNELAKQCFLQAIVHDSKSELAWLWLASVSDSPEEKVSHLQKVLSINPDNENATSSLKSTKNQMARSMMPEANQAAIAGNREDSLKLLDEILNDAPEFEDGWMLKAHLAESFEEKIAYFEQVLEVNPSNQVAKANIESLRAIVGQSNGFKDEDFESVEEALDLLEMDSDDSAEMNMDDSSDEDFEIDLTDDAQPESEADAVEMREEETDEDFEPAKETADMRGESDEFAGSEDEDYASEDEHYDEHIEAESSYEAEVSEEYEEHHSEENEGHHDEAVGEPEESEDDHVSAEVDFEPEESDDYDAVSYDESEIEAENQQMEADFEEEEAVPEDEDQEDGRAEFEADETETAQEAEHFEVKQVETKVCPFCNQENEQQSFACHSCNAVLTLSDMETLLSQNKADKDLIKEKLEEWEAAKEAQDISFNELKLMGIGYLNLKEYRKGFECLQEAFAKDTNNVLLSSHLDTLAIRISEIEEKANKSQPKSKSILVVDDSPTVRKLISGKLEKCGHEVVCAVDGMDALAKVNEFVPDLILLDITMPRMDGYQVCKLIRGNDATKDVPVVMISGKDGFFDKVRGKMAGTTNYITKPFGPETLMKTINEYIG